MSDVLLATSYHLSLDPKQARLMKPYPPLATITAAAVLREAGISIALHDAMFRERLAGFEAALDRERPRVVVLYEDSFNWLAKMCLSNMREAALDMARRARERGAMVLAAGPDASDAPEAYLSAGAAAVLVGEAELTLRERVLAYLAGRPGEHLPGMVVADPGVEGGTRRTGAREPLRDLDQLPMAAWDLIDIEAYRDVWRGRHGFFSLNQITTRGCPFRCNWCAKPVYGDGYQTRSPARVVEELAWVRHHLRPDHLWFADDILGLKKNWLLEWSERVASGGHSLPFMCQTRVDLMTDANVAALARAGAEEVWMGAESGDVGVLRAMEKGITPEDTRAAVARLKARGVRVALFLQLGYPGEGWEEITHTREMVRDCLPDMLGISVSYPLPGTRFYDAVAARLGAKTNWTHSDDLDPLFPGAFSREFYRITHRMIHHEHRIHLGRAAARRLLQRPGDASAADLKRAASLVKHVPGFIESRLRVELKRRAEGGGDPRPLWPEPSTP